MSFPWRCCSRCFPIAFAELRFGISEVIRASAPSCWETHLLNLQSGTHEPQNAAGVTWQRVGSSESGPSVSLPKTPWPPRAPPMKTCRFPTPRFSQGSTWTKTKLCWDTRNTISPWPWIFSADGTLIECQPAVLTNFWTQAAYTDLGCFGHSNLSYTYAQLGCSILVPSPSIDQWAADIAAVLALTTQPLQQLQRLHQGNSDPIRQQYQYPLTVFL